MFAIHPSRSVISVKLLCDFIEITFLYGCSPIKLLHIFRTSFPENTSGGLLLLLFRWSSHRRCSVKEGVLKNFAKFTGKHLCQRIFFNKIAALKKTLAQVFYCEFCKICNNTLSTDHLWATASENKGLWKSLFLHVLCHQIFNKYS